MGRNKHGNAYSKALAHRATKAPKTGSLIESIINSDFFPPDFESEEKSAETGASTTKGPDSQPVKRKPGRPRKPNAKKKKPASDNWVDGIRLVGNTYVIRKQYEGQRIYVSLKTDKWGVAQTRKTQLHNMLINGEIFKLAPEITVHALWERFEATHKGEVEESTFATYKASIEKALEVFGMMRALKVDNEIVSLLLNNYMGTHPINKKTGEPDTRRIEQIAKTWGMPKEDGTPWQPNFDSRNKGGANHLLTNLKTLFYHGVALGLVPTMPFWNQKFKHFKGARPIVGYTQIKPFLGYVAEFSRTPEDAVLQCMMGIFLGLRSDEIRRAEWWWIAWDQKEFRPRDTKGKECTAIPIPPNLMKKLEERFKASGEPLEDLIFPRRAPKRRRGKTGKLEELSTAVKVKKGAHVPRMRKRGDKRDESELLCKGWLNNVVAKAGMKLLKLGLTPHRLRATFATLHSLAGTPIRDIQAMLRHKHIGTTLIYIEDVPEIRWLAQRRMETLSGFGELGKEGARSLKSWQDDLAFFLREVPSEPEPGSEAPDPRLVTSEMVVKLEQLLSALKAA